MPCFGGGGVGNTGVLVYSQFYTSAVETSFTIVDGVDEASRAGSPYFKSGRLRRQGRELSSPGRLSVQMRIHVQSPIAFDMVLHYTEVET